jgi:hypothetical protein
MVPVGILGGLILMKRLVASLAGACLLMCGSAACAGERVMYQEITDNKPDVGVSTTVYLGDRMLEQRHGQWLECINRNFELSKISMELQHPRPYGGSVNSILCKKGGAQSNVYTGFPKPGEPSDQSFGIALWAFDDKGKIKFYHPRDTSKNACSFPMSYADLSPAPPHFVYSVNSLQQTLEYAGRNGGILKFIYTEFVNDLARPAFTREFQVDLGQGNVAAYKGAVIEIESATNASITYKVVRNFQQ